MAPISTITSSQPNALQSLGTISGTSGPEATTTSQAPAYQETLTTQGRAFALGLGAPRNHGDIEALFAEIATKFGAETAKATDYAEAAEDAKRSTALRAAAGNLGLCASLDAAIQAAEANIARQEAIIAKKTEEIDTKNNQIDALNAKYDEYRSEWNDNAATQLDNAGTIIELGFEIAAAWLVDDTAEVDRLQGQIDALEAQNSTLFNRNLYLDGEMFKIAGEVTKLGFEIAGLEIERGWAELSILGSEAEIGLAQGLLDTLGLIFIPFSVDLALRTIGEVGRASFEVTADQAGLDKAVEDATDNISDQAERMGVIAAARKALEQLPADDPATLSAINEVLAGNLPPGPADPETTAMTEAMLGLIAALRQMVGTGPNAEGPGRTSPVSGANMRSSQIDFLQDAIEENLPPDSGDPQKVASLAAGLAGGLALLRNILGQVADGETAMRSQVPGASGRLNLAI
jgi:hypothetical protein